MENTGSGSRRTRQSSTRVKQMVSLKRISRSHSKSNMQSASKVAFNLKTPICKALCVDIITPKVCMYVLLDFASTFIECIFNKRLIQKTLSFWYNNGGNELL